MMSYGIIIDGYSSGAGLVSEFNKLGIKCIHIQSTKEIPDIYIKTFDRNAYTENYIYYKDSRNSTLLNKLSEYSPLFAIPGSEPGIEVADLIANKLNLSTHNPLETSASRRNKFLMTELLKKNGLDYIPQFKSSNYIDIIKWVRNFGKWPVVIKPLKSAGGDKVKICYSENDIIMGFNEILENKPNMLNLIDNEALVQEYIEAPEFAVNTVQFNGGSYLSDVMQFHKILIDNGRKIYDYANFVPSDQYPPALVEYAFKVAHALDIKFGPMHAEIFMTKNGPLLIEAASRLMGANIPVDLMKSCLNHPQSYMTVLAYAKPSEFLSMVKEPPKIKKNLIILFLISNYSGELKKINYLDKIKNLQSFYDIKLRVNNHIYQTVDYDTSPGLIYLCHEDENVLNNDYLAIREFEKNNMYEVIA
jgi:biotin carboxylase